MFELFVSSVLPQCVVVFCHIMTACRVLQCSVTLCPPAVFYIVLPSITEQHHSQPNNRKEIPTINLLLTAVFAIHSVPYHSSRCTVQRTVIPFNMNCGISVGGRIIVYSLVFTVLAFPSFFFHSCSYMQFHPSFQKTSEISFSVLFKTHKTGLQISNSVPVSS